MKIKFCHNSHIKRNLKMDTSSFEDLSNQKMLSKYELSRLLGIRVNQLSMNAIPSISLDPNKSYSLLEIAALEIKHKTLDTVIRQNLPHGQYIDVNLKSMALPTDIDDILSMVNTK